MSDVQALLASAVLSATGFAPVSHSDLMYKLDCISPSGQTAMRDSMKVGIAMILQLNQMLGRLGAGQVWNFLHIVITDGQDTQSSTSLQDLCGLMMAVGMTIPVSRCRTVIIGIDLDADANGRAQLMAINQLGGENCDIYDVGSVNVGEIFSRLSVSLGVRRTTNVMGVQMGGRGALVVQQRNQPVLQVSQKRFAVLFNLDVSGSMSGPRWSRVKESVRSFLSQMPEGDLVAGIVFNGQVHPITKQ